MGKWKTNQSGLFSWRGQKGGVGVVKIEGGFSSRRETTGEGGSIQVGGRKKGMTGGVPGFW